MSRKGMEQLYPLREEEQRFKQYFHDAGVPFPQGAMTLEEFRALLPGEGERTDLPGYSKELEEESFFEEKLDVSVVQHMRYMPPVWHVQEFFEVECVLDGEICCYAGAGDFTMRRGDVLILAPGTNHAAAADREDGIMVNLLVRGSTFEESFFKLLPEDNLLHRFFARALYGTPDAPYLLFHTAGSGLLEERIPPILEEYRKNRRYKNTMLSGMLSVFFVELLRRHEKDVVVPSAKGGTMGEDMVYILQYLQNNYASLTLRGLASFFNYSERQMQRMIKAATDLTFTENILRLRIAGGKRLLRDTDLTVPEVAERLGFYDASSFRHAFRKQCGMTPAEYRRKERA